MLSLLICRALPILIGPFFFPGLSGFVSLPSVVVVLWPLVFGFLESIPPFLSFFFLRSAEVLLFESVYAAFFAFGTPLSSQLFFPGRDVVFFVVKIPGQDRLCRGGSGDGLHGLRTRFASPEAKLMVVPSQSSSDALEFGPGFILIRFLSPKKRLSLLLCGISSLPVLSLMSCCLAVFPQARRRPGRVGYRR